MIVSWNWLKDYVRLDMPHEELARRVMMAGLNHESTEEREGDLAIDFEVTSNRPDCLGHLGIAREIAVLFDVPLAIPAAKPTEGTVDAGSLVSVKIECPDLCYRYTARVVRGVKIGPSPRWLADRLKAVGIEPINNVVDISNYVLMECGQPLHTFDYAKLNDRAIVVRRPRQGESIEAIDHKTYTLPADACVIADSRDAVAIGGVMGGATTEISAVTRDVLVEAAEFNPISIRSTSRTLALRSDSSYRFERKVDPEGIDWASRRCCQMILDIAGGELARGSVDVGRPVPACESVVLRFSQLKRVLGIDVEPAVVRKILAALGNRETACDATSVTVVRPSWRRDLTREIDLVEEVARIHGYEKIPEDVRVPMASSVRTRDDRVLGKVRGVLTSAGFDEALTLSAVEESAAAAFSPWTGATPLVSQMPVIRGADRLRRSLVPSLLAARRTNESVSNPEIELFEIAKVYLPRGEKLPSEDRMIALTSGRDLPQVKGVIESLAAALNPALRLDFASYRGDLLDPSESCELRLDGELLGVLGAVSAAGLKQFELRGPTVVAELKAAPLIERTDLTPRYQPLPAFPAVTRDLNFVVDESLRWAELAETVQTAAGEPFESLAYCGIYRDAQRLGKGKKSLLMTLTLRLPTGTLTNQQADGIRDAIVAAAATKHGAELRK